MIAAIDVHSLRRGERCSPSADYGERGVTQREPEVFANVVEPGSYKDGRQGYAFLSNSGRSSPFAEQELL